jgi:hypothetical protein
MVLRAADLRSADLRSARYNERKMSRGRRFPASTDRVWTGAAIRAALERPAKIPGWKTAISSSQKDLAGVESDPGVVWLAAFDPSRSNYKRRRITGTVRKPLKY